MLLKKPLAIAVLINLCWLNHSKADITTGLVLKLQLDESSGSSAADSSGNANSGTLFNFIPEDSGWTTGRIGGGLRFNTELPSDDVVTVPDNGSLNFSGGLTFTLSAWVKASGNVQTNGGAIMAKGIGAGGEQYALDVVDGNFRFFVRSGVDPFPSIVLQSAVPANGSWQHVAAVFSSSGGIMKLMVNGQTVMSTNPPATLENNSHELSIGSRELSAISGYTLPFSGIIDDVRIYNRALTDSDVQELYLHPGIMTPSIVFQPQNASRFSGENASFSVVADGTIPLTYQWKKAGLNITGATNSSLILTNLQLTDAGIYSVGVTNSAGGTVSSNAVLQVTVLPLGDFTTGLIAKYDFDETSGITATDSAGTNTATLINFPGDDSQWVTGRIGGALRFNLPGDTVHDDLVETDGNVIFNNQDNFTFAFWVKLIDNDAGVNPRFITPTVTHWMLWSKNAGGVGLFTSRPSPVPQLQVWKHFAMTYNRAASTYTLFVNGTKITNAAPYAKAAPGAVRWIIGHAENPVGHGEYIRGDLDDVRIYNRLLADEDVKGLYDSAGIYPLQITKHPVGATKYERDNVTFSAAADGTLPFTYQWQHDNVNIPGATNSVLVVSDLTLSSAGNYRVVLNNGGQTVNSSNAVLQVLVLPPPDTNLGLVAHWTFDETSGNTAADSSGNGSSATLYNFPTDDSQWVPGQIGGALYFNRNGDTNDLVGVDAPLALQNGDQFTFTFWLKRDPGPALNNPRIITPLIDTEHWVLWTPNRGLGFFTTVPSPGPSSNTWTHFAVVFDRLAGTYTLFVNGKREVSEAGTYTRSDPLALSSLWIIGHAEIASRHSDPWRGLMDDLRVYNRLLTVSDVELLYFTDADVGPPLSLVQNGNSVSLSWSAVAPGGYALESSDTLGTGANWSQNLETPTIAAGLKTVTINLQAGTRFYRLRKP